MEVRSVVPEQSEDALFQQWVIYLLGCVIAKGNVNKPVIYDQQFLIKIMFLALTRKSHRCYRNRPLLGA